MSVKFEAEQPEENSEHKACEKGDLDDFIFAGEEPVTCSER